VPSDAAGGLLRVGFTESAADFAVSAVSWARSSRSRRPTARSPSRASFTWVRRLHRRLLQVLGHLLAGDASSPFSGSTFSSTLAPASLLGLARREGGGDEEPDAERDRARHHRARPAPAA
jgi:hypothetical protein